MANGLAQHGFQVDVVTTDDDGLGKQRFHSAAACWLAAAFCLHFYRACRLFWMEPNLSRLLDVRKETAG